MNQEDMGRINSNIEILVRDLETSLVSRSLIAAGIFNDSDFDLIQAKSTRDEKNHEMLAILKRRGPHAFEAFITALRNAGHGQEHLLELMNRDSHLTPSLSASGVELDALTSRFQFLASRQQINDQLPEPSLITDSKVPSSNVHNTDKMRKKFCETANQAFEELITKYFNTDYFEYETFKNWDVVKREDDTKRRSSTIIYRCNPQPSDEPYTLFGMKTELDASAELHFRDLLSNVELETLENPDYESVKRIDWLDEQSDILHVVPRHFNIFVTGREVVMARHWRKISNAYIICGRSIETDKVPPSATKYRYYTRFAAARYTPVPGNENQCVYEALVSGDPGGWVSGHFAMQSSCFKFFFMVRNKKV
uniref:CARD domain-containing protein n=1 Tax=Plectus sambesii TaxID=2011161 RepID=A0A914WZ27_9BILA